MTLGIFTDDLFPDNIGGMGRYVYEVASRLPVNRTLVFSPGKNTITNHIKVEPVFHNKLKNLSFSLWLHHHIHRTVKKYDLSRINIQCGPGGLFLLKQTDVPVIATCHHTWWQQSHYIKSQFWKRMFIPFEKRTYQQANRIICDSEDSRQILIKRYHLGADKIVVIPIGVDKNRFYPIDGVKKIPDSLLFVGRMDKRKGADFLIRAMPLVKKSVPKVKLLMGGTGKDLPKLKKFVKENNLEKNVEFLGFIPEDKLNEWYNKVQSVVVPSRFEGFGLTVIEAMAAGTSVIAARVDALKNIVAENIDGFLVEYGDIRALNSKIVTLLGDKAKRAAFTEKGKAKVRDIYNWDVIIQAFIKEVNDP